MRENASGLKGDHRADRIVMLALEIRCSLLIQFLRKEVPAHVPNEHLEETRGGKKWENVQAIHPLGKNCIFPTHVCARIKHCLAQVNRTPPAPEQEVRRGEEVKRP